MSGIFNSAFLILKKLLVGSARRAGGASDKDKAKPQKYAASSMLMTNAIRVAKTIIAHRPVAPDAPQVP